VNVEARAAEARRRERARERAVKRRERREAKRQRRAERVVTVAAGERARV